MLRAAAAGGEKEAGWFEAQPRRLSERQGEEAAVHLLNGAEAQALDRIALPLRQRRAELEAMLLEHTERHGDEHGIGVDAVAATLCVHTHAVGPMLDLAHLALGEHLQAGDGEMRGDVGGCGEMWGDAG